MSSLTAGLCATGLTLLTLVGCSSSPKALMPLKDDLFTEHFNNGLQVFVYTVRFPATPLNPLESRNGARQSRSAKSIEGLLRIDERLQKRLERDGYCEAGFIELERFIGVDHARIRGECR